MNKRSLHVLVLQGPNLNLLGLREPEVYGAATLEDIHADLTKQAETLGVKVDFFQSNHEGALIDRIQAARAQDVDGLILNAGSLTHTSIGLRDALKGTALPFVEVHISNVHAREEFRHHSFLSAIASGIVVGFGVGGYRLALTGLVEKLRDLRSDARS